MNWFVRVEGGVVQELIPPFETEGGVKIPIGERFTLEFVDQLIDVTELKPMPESGWNYDGSSFSPPVPYQPSPAELVASNTAVRDSLLQLAARAIAPLQYAVDLEDATPAEAAQLKKWKQYSVSVNRVDLALADPTWPVQP
ncbi:tail fiber assembly protein [Pseudomonas sp. A4]|nr:tail fiber assembly protein [Pseudomonas sp. S11A4]MCR8975529.1 tail fiber assembly protein [Pseudomonas sp. S11P7]